MRSSPAVPTPGTRDRLLDTAERLFSERGFEGTSAREITSAARANLGAINYYFRSKENLYTAVFERRVAQLRDPILAAARETKALARRQPEVALRAIGRAFLAPHQDPETAQRLVGLFARENIEACLPAGLLAREMVAPVSKATTDIVREVRPDLSEVTAQACARAFFAQLMHVVKGVSKAAPLPVDERLELAVRFTVAAVRHIEDPSQKRTRGRKPRRSSS